MKPFGNQHQQKQKYQILSERVKYFVKKYPNKLKDLKNYLITKSKYIDEKLGLLLHKGNWYKGIWYKGIWYKGNWYKGQLVQGHLVQGQLV